MELSCVNREVWKEFKSLVPERHKSRIITELLREEVARRKRENRLEALARDFKEAARDREQEAEASAWDALDVEGWPE